jgi:hypothetical protein
MTVMIRGTLPASSAHAPIGTEAGREDIPPPLLVLKNLTSSETFLRFNSRFWELALSRAFLVAEASCLPPLVDIEELTILPD